jgi:hypothetical protein
MILVILHHQEKDYYNHRGEVVSKAGTYVSHGIDTETSKTVILPCDKWRDFQHNCVLYEGEWYLK